MDLREVIHGLEPQRAAAVCSTAKIVPARTDVCLRQALHWNSLRVPRSRRNAPCRRNRAFEALRPAPVDERRVALLLASIGRVERAFAEAFLKLHLVTRHRLVPLKSICSLFVLYGKPKLINRRKQERS